MNTKTIKRIFLGIIFALVIGCGGGPNDYVVGVLPPYNGGGQTCTGPCGPVGADAGQGADAGANSAGSLTP